MKKYCTQNNGECSTCSLSSYGKDCRNNAIQPKKARTFRLSDETINKLSCLAKESNMTEVIENLVSTEYKKESVKMRKKLDELKKKYDDIYDDICVFNANGNLGKLCNLRDKFDESFDSFFDREELRRKYNAWDDEDNCPKTEYCNRDLEDALDNVDLKDLISFYENCIGRLEDELNELQDERNLNEIL